MAEIKDVKECPYCAEEIKEQAIRCRYCQADLKGKNMLSAGWVVGTILLPIVGIIGGIYGLVKGHKSAGGLLIIGLGLWILYYLIYLFLSHPSWLYY